MSLIIVIGKAHLAVFRRKFIESFVARFYPFHIYSRILGLDYNFNRTPKTLRMSKFMITIALPSYFTPEYVALIPKQRAVIVEMLSSGLLSSFSLNRERTQVWMVANCKDESAVRNLVKRFPMHKFFEYDITELIVHDTEFMGLPKVVLN
jgi:hypothetical protein